MNFNYIYQFIPALSEPEVLEDSLERDLLITQLNTVSISPITETLILHVTDKPTKIAPDVEDAHPVHQNQLVPSNTVHVPLRAKGLSEKNGTDEASNADLGKSVLANQFEQKVKSMRAEKVVEAERRARRGLKPFTRKGEFAFFLLFLFLIMIVGCCFQRMIQNS